MDYYWKRRGKFKIIVSIKEDKYVSKKAMKVRVNKSKNQGFGKAKKLKCYEFKSLI